MPSEVARSCSEFRGLPRRDVTWQLGFHQMDEDDSVWLVGIGDVNAQKMLLLSELEEEPTAESVWPALLSAFLRPIQGKPHRPARLEVPRPDLCAAWQGTLTEASVDCVCKQDPQPIGECRAVCRNRRQVTIWITSKPACGSSPTL